MKNVRELRDKQLAEAEDLITAYFTIVLGKAEASKYVGKETRIIEAYKHMFPQGLRLEDDRAAMNSSSTAEEILKAMSKGEISINEAKHSMGLFVQKIEADEVPRVLEKLVELAQKK